MARQSFLFACLVAFLLVTSEVAAREMAETSIEKLTKGKSTEEAKYEAHTDQVGDCQRYGCCAAVFGPSTGCPQCCTGCRYGCCDAVFGPGKAPDPCQYCCPRPN